MMSSLNSGELLDRLRDPSPESRVMVRWWWFGSSNTEADINQQLDAMLKAGLGGVELCCVYPLATIQPTTYGSPRFLELVRHASEGARRRGMRFDLTVGSGWSYGGSHVPPEHAAKRLRFDYRVIGPGAQQLPVGQRWPGDRLEGAWVCDGAYGEHDGEFRSLSIKDDLAAIPAGGSPRTILLAISGPTGQQLKRASNGAEGPVLDHYSREATLHHLETVGKPFFHAAGGNGAVTSIFCDSLEVYESDWSPTLVDEFNTRRGYDPQPLLYQLWLPKPQGRSFKADYYRTLSEVYEDNFLAVSQDWAKRHGTQFRVQNYGHPPARVCGYRFADIIEGERWGWTGIPQSKWASSAAHHFGKQIVSSEGWTWINSPTLKARPLDFKGEAHEQILCGINHFIGHGWPSSPLNAPSPGWALYASGAITDRNAWWEAASKPLFSYLHRLCDIVRHGEPVADIGLWLPYQDTYSDFEHGEELNLWKASAKRIGTRVPCELRQAGYDFDVIDAGLSAEGISLRHRAVIVAGSSSLSNDDVRHLAQIAANGTALIVVDSDILPGATHISVDRLLETLGTIILPDVPTGSTHVGAVHRKVADADLYFLANTDAQAREYRFQPKTAYSSWERWNLCDSSIVRGTGGMRGELAAYEAVVYITRSDSPPPRSTPAAASDPLDKSPVSHSSRLPLTHWTFHRPGGHQEKVLAPHVWDDSDNFAGSATYSTRIDLDAPPPSIFILDITQLPTPVRTQSRDQSYEAHSADPVGVVATVHVNGQDAGVLWDPPYAVPVGHLLRTGGNTIDLTVSTTSLRATRSDEWRKMYTDAERTFGRRFIMKDIEQAGEPQRSGLLVVPELR